VSLALRAQVRSQTGLFLVIAVCAALILAQAVVFRWAPVDDAYISFRYAAHLAAGDGLVFNVGERVEGYSNFLWTLILGGAAWISLDIPHAAVWLGVVFALISVGLTFWLARVVGAERDWPVEAALYAALLVGVYPGWSYYAFSGLEGPLITCLVLGFILAGTRHGSWRLVLAAGLLGVLAAMTRWEAVILWPVVVGAKLFDRAEPKGRKVVHAAVLSVILLVGFGIYFVWRFGYYGELLPNTYYVKVAAPLTTRLARGVAYTGEFAISWLLPITLVVWTAGRFRGLSGVLLATLGVYVGYVTWTGGDFFPWLRFYLPVIPIAAIMLVDTVVRLARQARTPAGQTRYLWAIGAAAALTVAGLGLRIDLLKAKSHRDLVSHWQQVGLWARTALAPDCRIGITPAGAIPFLSGLPTLDMLGLTDFETAHFGTTDPREGPGHQRSNIPSILNRRPEVILGEAYLYPTPPAPEAVAAGATRRVLRRLYADPEFQRLYDYQVARIGDEYLPYWVRRDRVGTRLSGG
jgi:arabinofuranosyltransferase